MKHEGFDYEVLAKVTFTGHDLKKLSQWAGEHYDGNCNASVKRGGLLFDLIGWWWLSCKQYNKRFVSFDQLSPELLDREFTKALTFRELDLLGKIAEREICSFWASRALQGGIGTKIWKIMQSINSEYDRLKNLPTVV